MRNKLIKSIFAFKTKDSENAKNRMRKAAVIPVILLTMIAIFIYGFGFSLTSKGKLNNDGNVDAAKSASSQQENKPQSSNNEGLNGLDKSEEPQTEENNILDSDVVTDSNIVNLNQNNSNKTSDGILNDNRVFDQGSDIKEPDNQSSDVIDDNANGNSNVNTDNSGTTSGSTINRATSINSGIFNNGTFNSSTNDTNNTDKEPVTASVSIVSAPKYIEKSGKAIIEYEIISNKTEAVTKVRINHNDVPVNNIGGNKYQAEFIVPDTSGKFELSTKKVFIGEDSVDVSAVCVVEILKTPFTINNYSMEDISQGSNSSALLKFTVNDPDNTFVDGIVEILDATGNVTQSIRYNQGDNVIRVPTLLKDTQYRVKITGKYERDIDGTAYVSESVLLEKPLYSHTDYSQTISDLGTYNGSGTATAYFDKNASVTIKFKHENSSSNDIAAVKVNGSVYNVSKNSDVYSVNVTAPKTAGVFDYSIDALILSSAEEIKLDNAQSVKVDVLKDLPKLTNLKYVKSSTPGKVQVTFDLIDVDNTLSDAATVQILSDGSTVSEVNVNKGTNAVEFDYTPGKSYTFSLLVSYDLDSNSIDNHSNAVSDTEMASEPVVLTSDNLELKDITKTTLYHNGIEVAELDITNGIPTSPTDLDNYSIKIEMKKLPVLYTGVKSFNKASDGLYAVADLNEFVKYTNTETGVTKTNEVSFEIPYVENGELHKTVMPAKEWFDQVAADLSGEHNLTCDLDASDITGNTAAIMGTFKGRINGNGHTIYNLSVPLFQTISGGTVSGITIENANVANASSIFANIQITGNSRIENCYIKSSSIYSPELNMVSGFVRIFERGTISNCGIDNLTINGRSIVGGIAAETRANSRIENCYVNATLNATHEIGSHGARVGGISGSHGGGVIEKCFVDVNISAPSNKGNGGIIGGPNNANSGRIANSVSIADGNCYRIAGFAAALVNIENLYEYAASTGVTNIDDTTSGKIQAISDINTENLYTTLGMDKSIWDYIQSQNYEVIKNIEGYDSTKEVAYLNIAKIAPYANVEDWVKYGNGITDADFLSKKISFVLPLDSNHQNIVGLNKGTENTVAKMKVVFEDGSSKEYDLSFSHTSDRLIAIYNVSELGMPYHFNKYVANLDDGLKSELITELQTYDYEKDIASTTTETERRQYVDYYNETVAGELDKFVENLLMSQEIYPSYIDDAVLKGKLKENLLNNLKRLAYSYNYFAKWYDFNIGDINMLDLLYFDGQLLNRDLTTEYLTQQVYAGTRGTEQTTNFYNTAIQPKIGKNLYDTFEFFMAADGSTDPNEWFADNFKGILKEQPALGAPAGMNIKYRIWDNLIKGPNKDGNLLLPIMTAPQEDMILFSAPSHVVISSINRYYAQNTEQNRQKMLSSLDTYGEWVGRLYGSSAGVVPNAESWLNSSIRFSYDTRFNYPAQGKYPGTQVDGASQEPVFKWVTECVRMIGAATGDGAYATGPNIYWIAYAAFGNEFIFKVFTHENAHAQDGNYFYNIKGRRSGSGPEAHADGNLAQELADGGMVFNWYKEVDITTEITNNFSYARVDTPAEIQDYYRDMFETGYVMDYLLGQAFLQLSPEEQAKVAVQASHTPDGKSFSTTYSRLTADAIQKMDLRDMEDLWDNKIMLRPTGTVKSSSYGDYGAESFWHTNWYQPHNDNGTPDSNSFKRLGQEMLGVGGYENGYIPWISGQSKNDLEALRIATGNDTITWRDYKLGRYDTIAGKLDKIPYFDSSKVITDLVAALKQDAGNGNLNASTNLKKIYYHIVKRATNDFTDGNIYELPTVTTITSAQQLIDAVNANKLGNYKLGQDIDFSSVQTTNPYYMGQFVGTLDGAGYKITGLSCPLFNNITYANISNLNIDSPVFTEGTQAVISVSSNNVIVSNINITKANAKLPLIKTRNRLYYEYNITKTEKVIEIRTYEDLVAIGKNELSLKGNYKLINDINISNKNSNAPIINGVFGGVFDGNGYTIFNSPSALFNEISDGEVKNLKIRSSNITNLSSRGTLANILRNSKIYNIYIQEANIRHSRNAQRVGGLAGEAHGEVYVSRVCVLMSNISSFWEIGGIIGHASGPTTFTDVAFEGTIAGTRENQPYDGRMGGIVGTHAGVAINNAYVDVNITAPKDHVNGNGAFIGNPTKTAATISNSVATVTGNYYTIVRDAIVAHNVYEVTSSSSSSEGLIPVTLEERKTAEFYKDRLGWSEEIWNLHKFIIRYGAPQIQFDNLVFTTPIYTIPKSALMAKGDDYKIASDTVPVGGDSYKIASDTVPVDGNSYGIASDTVPVDGDSYRIASDTVTKASIGLQTGNITSANFYSDNLSWNVAAWDFSKAGTQRRRIIKYYRRRIQK